MDKEKGTSSKEGDVDDRATRDETASGVGDVAVAPEALFVASTERKAQTVWQTVIALLFFAGVWQLMSLRFPEFVVPGWERIVPTLLELNYGNMGITGLRVLGALFAAFSIGLSVAFFLSNVPRAEGYVLPVVKMLMAVPAISWVLFSVLWFSNIEQRIAFVLIVEATPIFLIQILDAIKSIPNPLREMMRAFRPRRAEYYRKLVVPAVIPTIFTSWKITLALSIRVVTIAELVGAVSGIGYALAIAQHLFSIADVFAWTMVLVGMLLAAQIVVTFLESRLLKWRPA